MPSGNFHFPSKTLGSHPPSYFSTPASRDAAAAPPFDPTKLVNTGTNLAAISGESPRDLKAVATGARPPTFPGRADAALPKGEPPLKGDFGAAAKSPSMPGTASETLPNSSGLRRLLARPNKAPAPPVACFSVTFRSLLSWPTSSGLGLAPGATADTGLLGADRGLFGSLGNCACAGMEAPKRHTIVRTNRILFFMTSPPFIKLNIAFFR